MGVHPSSSWVAGAVQRAAPFFPDERRAFSRTRQRVIEANPGLQERERHKMASLAAALGAALRAGGVEEPAATLAAESGMTVFGVAFAMWIRDDETRPFGEIAADVVARLRALAG